MGEVKIVPTIAWIKVVFIRYRYGVKVNPGFRPGLFF